MTDNDKVLINLATGLEDAERVTVALLVATAALSAGKHVAVWLTKQAVRRTLPGFAEAGRVRRLLAAGATVRANRRGRR